MKKFILLLFILIFAVFITVYFADDKILNLVDEKKEYEFKILDSEDLNLLNESVFFKNGIISFNNQKIIFMDLNNNVIWNNEKSLFADKIYITDDYIYRSENNSIEVIDKNNRVYEMHEIEGNIINVSRENDITCIITKLNNGQNSIFLVNEENEIIVRNKIFDDIITGVSPSDRSEAYAISTLGLNNGIPLSTLYFNLLDDVELWKVEFEEIILGIKVVNNNVIAVGMDNIYYYNTNGKLMWKNSIYNKILDFEIKREDEKINILYEQDNNVELISYTFEGKVKELYSIPGETDKIKRTGKKLIVFNENDIYLLHNSKADKLYENREEKIYDIILDNNIIYILFKDKLVKGQIK